MAWQLGKKLISGGGRGVIKIRERKVINDIKLFFLTHAKLILAAVSSKRMQVSPDNIS